MGALVEGVEAFPGPEEHSENIRNQDVHFKTMKNLPMAILVQFSY